VVVRKDQAGRSAPTLDELTEAVGFGRSHASTSFGPHRRRRTFRVWLNDWAARESVISKLTRRFGHALFDRHPRVGGVIALVAGGVGAGYLWAAASRHGLHGGLSGQALDNAGTYPDANAAMIGAIGLAGVGWLVVFKSLFTRFGRDRRGQMFVVSVTAVAITGLAFFLISLAIWHY
jgi:hypothetical protein